MRSERGPLRRLEELISGTRVRLAPGRVGTLVSVNFTRAIVELDSGDDRRREIAPACEVEVLTTAMLPAGDVAAGPARNEKGPGTALRPAEMRNTDPGRPGSPTGARYALEATRAGSSGSSICARRI